MDLPTFKATILNRDLFRTIAKKAEGKKWHEVGEQFLAKRDSDYLISVFERKKKTYDFGLLFGFCLFYNSEKLLHYLTTTRAAEIEILWKSEAYIVRKMQLINPKAIYEKNVTQSFLSFAARKGNIPMISLLKKSFLHTPSITRSAIYSENLSLLQWLKQNKLYSNEPNLIDLAAQIGNVNIVEWLHNNQPQKSFPWSPNFATKDAIDLAARKGHFEVVKWLYKNRTEGASRSAVNYAAAGGHLELLIWLLKNKKEVGTNPIDFAAGNGHLKVIEWLHSAGQSATYRAMDGAAANGDLAIVEWLHKNRSEGCSAHALINAVKGKHLQLMQYLVEVKREKVADGRLPFTVICTGSIPVAMYLLPKMKLEISPVTIPLICINEMSPHYFRWLHTEFSFLIDWDVTLHNALLADRIDLMEVLVHEIFAHFKADFLEDAAKKCSFSAIQWIFNLYEKLGSEQINVNMNISGDDMNPIETTKKKKTPFLVPPQISNPGWLEIVIQSGKLDTAKFLLTKISDYSIVKPEETPFQSLLAPDAIIPFEMNYWWGKENFGPEFARQAAQEGSIEMLEWFIKHFPAFKLRAVHQARNSSKNFPHLVDWLAQFGQAEIPQEMQY
jgi:ankyrin repeat protein